MTVVDIARQLGILVPNAKQVEDYLRDFVVLHNRLMRLLPYYQQEFGTDAQLSLEMFYDPDGDDKFLTLYLRKSAYPEHWFRSIEKARTRCTRWLYRGEVDGWFLITTDFQKPL